MSCNCGCDCKIPTGPIGPQGIQGEVGPQGPAGADGAIGLQGPAGDLVPFEWIDLPLINSWLTDTGLNKAQYCIRNGFVWFRGVVWNPLSTASAFTTENFGVTTNIITTAGEQHIIPPNTTIFLEKLMINPSGMMPLNNNIHYIYLDSITPVSIR